MPWLPDLHAVPVADHHRDVEAYQGSDVRGVATVGAQDSHRLPGARERGHDLAHPVFRGPHVRIDVGEQPDLGSEIDEGQRIVVGIEAEVGADRRLGEGTRVARVDRLHGRAGPPDGFLAELRGVGVSRGLPGNRPQPEPLIGVEAGALDAAVVERDRFGLGVFQEQLAVIGAVQASATSPSTRGRSIRCG